MGCRYEQQDAAVNKIATTRGFGLFVLAAALTLTQVSSVRAAGIEGTIVVKKKLTKRRVTAQVPMYERGPAVEFEADTEEDALAFERSRVAVYLEGQFPAQPAVTPIIQVMGQTNRRFSPELLVVQAGSKVSFPNNDPIFHNVFSLSGPKTFDLGNYPRGDTRIVAFPEPGVVYVNCHLHSNMTAAIVVTPNRWNARADRDGRFELPDVPPGKYTIVAWHKTAGFFRQSVVVSAGANERVEFLIPVDENGHRIDASRLATVKLQAGRE
jgi:plastocyanin